MGHGPRVRAPPRLSNPLGAHRPAAALQQVQDRSFRLSPYPCCFVARDAIDYFVTNKLAVNRYDGLKLLRMLVISDTVHHVTDAHEAKDEKLFFRFRADDKAGTGPSVASFMGKVGRALAVATAHTARWHVTDA